MTQFRVEVSLRAEAGPDARGAALAEQIAALGIDGVRAVRVSDLFFLEGRLTDDDAQQIAEMLLTDTVVEDVEVSSVEEGRGGAAGGWVVEVARRPGVTDSVAETLIHGAHMLGFASLARAATGHRYALVGDLSRQQVDSIAGGLLANSVIQHYTLNQPVAPPFAADTEPEGRVESIPVTGASDGQLELISKERRLSMDLEEMRAIRAHYQEQGREPTDLELEMLAQTWSEHCVHKTFRALISYREEDVAGRVVAGSERQIDGMLGTYIRAATDAAARPWVRSAFVDNAGIVALDATWDLAFKVETHNHPSALEPFGGANTGVGGVVRDVIGVSARPIATTNVLCFGPEDMLFDALPDGVLHPRRVAAGVIAGIEDYGNKMGIPTVNGAIVYDRGYTSNPLVFCGCLGLLPTGSHPTNPGEGDRVVVIGGRTGRDGLRGATFSSMEMSHETGEIAGSSVQIGHPIHEKQALEAIMIARDEKLYSAITDCGAGGLSSAVGEMGAQLGAEVELERVPLKYAGLEPWEIWLSEAQERMVLAVPPENWPRIKAICDGLDIEATDLGQFTGDGRLVLRYKGRVVGDMDARFLHDGIPRRRRDAVWRSPGLEEPESLRVFAGDLSAELLALLALPEICSKEETVRRYDHEVQGATVVKPMVGVWGDGPGDATVLAPLSARPEGDGAVRGVALSAGINPFYGAIDPYQMARAAVDEAMRNVVAVGGDPEQASLLDNFCWGNPNLPDRLGGLVRCAHGCYDAAVAFGAPYVSGKDSLNNEYADVDGERHPIPGTILISALAIVPDVRATTTSDLKRAGNALYLLGVTYDELGGSAWYRHHGHVGARVPVAREGARALFGALHGAIKAGLVAACHDCSEGGLAVALTEMAIGGRLGARISLETVLRGSGVEQAAALCFSESLSRFVVEVAPEHADAFEGRFDDLLARIGEVCEEQRVVVVGVGGKEVVVEVTLDEAVAAWRGHVGW